MLTKEKNVWRCFFFPSINKSQLIFWDQIWNSSTQLTLSIHIWNEHSCANQHVLTVFLLCHCSCWLTVPYIKLLLRLGQWSQDFSTNVVLFFSLKFMYSEKTTKFCKISTLLLSYVVPVKSKVEISQNFLTFSEYMNFITDRQILWGICLADRSRD